PRHLPPFPTRRSSDLDHQLPSPLRHPLLAAACCLHYAAWLGGIGITMFGCGGDSGLYHLSDELTESVARVDRLERADELVRDRLGEILEARRLSRRQIFRTA